ncbi:MAG: DUF3887 domain-containing protein [Lachnospiraceae bacterium]|jgi:hypothetical protein|nr:DUF3887 domain-containing protein [Lachnospiraceae bacterium]
MNANQYVNAVIKKIKCNGKKKEEIKRQLLTDIDMRMRQGERLEEIISGMGSVQEIADGFNESISPTEQKKYRRNMALKIVIPIAVVLVLLSILIYWMFPKGRDIEQSKYFDKAQVEAAMKETVTLLDEGASDDLQENAIPQMQKFLDKAGIQKIKATMSDDWGQRQQFGAVYMTELVQGNQHLAIGEITVTYENISVIYRLTYDQDMKLAGLYVR